LQLIYPILYPNLNPKPQPSEAVQESRAVIRLLKTKDAAEYLGLSVRTLENWRYQGRGPKCVLMGRTVRYDLQDLDAWVSSHRETG
jgi:excisionase family DNA binding protein